MRVGLITTKLNFKTGGGSVTDLHLKAKGLIELGHEVFVITTRSAANSIEAELPYKVFEENIDARSFIRLQSKTYQLIKKYQDLAEVFYIDGNNFLYGAGFYKLFGGRTPIAAFFNMRLNCWRDPEMRAENFLARAKRRFRFFLEHHLGNPVVVRLEAFIYNTPHLAEVYYDFGHKKNKSFIVEDMVNTLDLMAERGISAETVKARLNSADKINIYCSGRLLKEKGFDLVIKAINELGDKEKYRVVIGGTGPDEARLKQLVKDLNLESIIDFPGWLEKEKMYENLSRAQIFIFPKWWTEYGSVVLTEAMALGLPCLIPAGGALAWLSEGGSLPFAVDDEKDLARKIQELADNEALRIKLALGGLKRAQELDYKNLTLKLEKALKFAVENKK